MKKTIALILVLIIMTMSNAFASVTPEGLPILTEKETYTIAVTLSTRCENTFAEKQASIMAEEATNVHIEWIEIPESSWDEQVNILIASGEIPDAFCSPNEIDTMSNRDILVPLNDLIAEHAPNITEMLEASPEIKAAITAKDGNIYSLPTGKDQPQKAMEYSVWINAEWCEKLGYELPTTTEEYVEVLKAFRDKDPNGNNKNDEIPLTLKGVNYQDVLYGSFGVMQTSNYVYSLDGENVLFCGQEEGYYDALNWMHMLYEEKLLDNEVFTQTSAELTAKATNEDLLIGSIIVWSPDSLDKRFTDYVILDPLVGPEGYQYYTKNSEPLGFMQGFCITTACENPEVLIRYYDYNISSLEVALTWMYGPENAGCWEPIETTADGKTWQQTSRFVTENMSLTYFKYTAAGGDYSPMYLWSKYTDVEQLDARNAKKLEGINRCMPYSVIVMPAGVDDPDRAVEREQLFVDIDNYMQKFRANAVKDGLTEEDWAKHLEQLKKLDVERYVELWQEYFTEKNSVK